MNRFHVIAVVLVMLTGSYNAFVINSDSTIEQNIKFVKRLDEAYGVVTPGRVIAATVSWKRLPAPLKKSKVAKTSNKNKEEDKSFAEAAIQEELNLSLIEVINVKKWKKGLAASQFSGNLSTSNGIIENLTVSLPNGRGISVSFSEMSGNVFEYDYNGELFSGMLYQVDPNSYMVTLSNGPLEGTRFKFAAETVIEDPGGFGETDNSNQQTVASAPEEHDLKTSSFKF
ncbi:MAG TPA: hypothetical protein VNJ08_00195 [Bacteriovoracaceae bacterium]|nr:hypothetical protein [Bacteriovoracaceae bacterium]